ncbi:conserved repeat domain-containing protein/Por secretion system C-terminal sorting domain-containing protein [Chryseobacterium taeanense]|uniref:Conserved repeat domain-containing protein/Por secretion system C-terminal sorting domain-containing protein n=1 Tax=Chryseobacterium taeanense TaxID=311334 RepID=A0A1G8LU24_9FLAO|nr:T9SS type A sorting domain-containing protein [Chryseobacterium taeanense]SDI59199.1 conserved repeat domain-containing protein/Por secretion system C-terminal sorting domain-containing protein [Chryseobacterium taeanense]
MRKIYLVVSLIMFAVFQAQIVNIPDPAFKARLLSADVTTNNQIASNINGQAIKIDANSNGEIEVSEAANVAFLTVSVNAINDITGIQSFSNLRSLSLFGFGATSINVSGLSNLNYLTIQALDNLTSIDIANCTNLENLKIISCSALTSLNPVSSSIKNISVFSGNLNQLDVTGCPALVGLSLQATKISTLNLSNFPNLKTVDLLSNYQLQNINFQGSNKLYSISISSCGVSNVSVANLPQLWKLECNSNGTLNTVSATNCAALERLVLNYNNNLTNLNVNNLPSILILDIFKNKFSSIDISSLATLQLLRCDENYFPSLDLNQNTALVNLECTKNLLQSLDLSHNPLLYTISCGFNNNLQNINLKSGSQNFPYGISINNLPQLKFICIDDNKLNDVLSTLNAYGYSNVVTNSYCSFTPGGIFYTIQGNTKYDSNNNGCDINDANKAFQKFNVTNGTVSGSLIANNSGNYSIAVGAGSHTITPILENPTYFNISPTNLTANFPTQTSPLAQNFCISANGTHNDLETFIIPITQATPGFNAKYKIVYKNKGTGTQSGTLSFNYNDNVMDYLSSTVAPNSQSTGLLNWNFTNLLPFETREITVTLKLNTPTQTPALNGGDVLHYTAQVNAGTDETPLDNTFTLNQTVVNSFDPNDKTCLEGTTITQAKVGDYVHYLIRFENTGTANAQNIVVKDDIDASKYDLSSLASLTGSHDFVTRITGNTVEFIFENIQLPFDDANNDGYVSFKIKTKSTLNVGDSFSNKAGIYFDYNAPIITNNFMTTVQNTLAASEINKENKTISIYPNPVQEVLNIKSKNEITKAEIFDAAGRILISTHVKGNSINVSELVKGNYIIKLFTKDKTFTQKFIKN